MLSVDFSLLSLMKIYFLIFNTLNHVIFNNKYIFNRVASALNEIQLLLIQEKRISLI